MHRLLIPNGIKKVMGKMTNSTGFSGLKTHGFKNSCPIKIVMRNISSFMPPVDSDKQMFHRFCKEGNLEEVRTILSLSTLNKANMIDNCQINESGYTPLHTAAKYGHAHVVKYLIRSGANVDLLDKFDMTPLHVAVKTNHVEVVKLLLSAGANGDKQNKWSKDTALHMAAEIGSAQITRLLIDVSVDINKLNNDGDSPLHTAAKYSRDDIVQLLTNYGAKINVQNKALEETPLYLAASNGDIRSVETLVIAGADANMKNLYGHTPLYSALVMESTEVVRILAAVTDLGLDYQYLRTPLISFTRYGRKDAVQLTDFSPEIMDEQEQLCEESALLTACRYGLANIAELLVKNSADINQTDKNGDTPLHAAVKAGHTEIVRILLAGRPCLDMTNEDNDTAISIAVQKGHTAIVKLMLFHGVDKNTLCFQSKVGTDKGLFPLYYAAAYGYVEIARMLLTYGANVNKTTETGRTALTAAASKGHFKIALMLIEYGADVNATDKLLRTPLINAVEADSEDIVKLLIARKANYNAVDKYGKTALYHAASLGQTDTIKLLVANGADVNTVNKFGQSALWIAGQFGFEDTVQLLKDAGAK